MRKVFGAGTISVLLVLALSLCLLWRLLPLGIPRQWVWPYREELLPFGEALALFLVLLAGSGAGWAVVFKRPRRAAGVIFLIALFLRLARVHVEPFPVMRQIWVATSPVSNTYFGEALRMRSPWEFVRHYEELLPSLTEHARTHPPGPALYYRIFVGLTKRSEGMRKAAEWWLRHVDWMEARDLAEALSKFTGLRLGRTEVAAALWAQYALLVVSACLCLALVGFGGRLLSRGEALFGALLLSLSPSALAFSVTVDSLVALLCALGLLLLVREKGGGWRGLASGAVLYLACFVSLSALAVVGQALLFALLSAFANGSESRPWREGMKRAGMVAGGFVALYLLFLLAFGFDLLGVLVRGLGAHREVTLAFKRSYWAWLLLNPLDFGAFAGLPICVLAARGLGLMREGMRRAFVLSFVITFLLLDLSGLVRGEVARIWLFFLPSLCLMAGRGMEGGRRALIHLLALALQAAVMGWTVEAVRPY